VLYRIYHSVGHHRHVMYETGSELWLDPTSYPIAVTSGHTDRFPAAIALDSIYEAHVFETGRPDQSVAPPLAVGDVIALEVSPGAVLHVAVTEDGFAPVDEPLNEYLVLAPSFDEAAERWTT
jgi:hypothetical protein